MFFPSLHLMQTFFYIFILSRAHNIREPIDSCMRQALGLWILATEGKGKGGKGNGDCEKGGGQWRGQLQQQQEQWQWQQGWWVSKGDSNEDHDGDGNKGGGWAMAVAMKGAIGNKSVGQQRGQWQRRQEQSNDSI
jgi:hypothetical protein